MAAVKGASSTRARQAAATRELVVDAADALMRRDGYVATSIAAIAAEAGVAVQTVYNAVGSKRDVLDAVLDRAASGSGSGSGSARSVPELMTQRVDEARSAAEVVAVLADWFTQVHPRVLPILQLIRQADAVDDAPSLEAARSTQRRRNYELAARALLERPGARELPPAHIAATIWSVGHPQVYAQLVVEEGWTIAMYREWVGSTLEAALVAAPSR